MGDFKATKEQICVHVPNAITLRELRQTLEFNGERTHMNFFMKKVKSSNYLKFWGGVWFLDQKIEEKEISIQEFKSFISKK